MGTHTQLHKGTLKLQQKKLRLWGLRVSAGGEAGGVTQGDSQARTRMSSQKTAEPISEELASREKG